MTKKAMLNKKLKQTIKGFLVVFLFKTIAVLPQFINRFLAKILGNLTAYFNSKTTNVIRTNLSICYPDLSKREIDDLLKANIKQNAKLVFEFPIAWLSKKSKVVNLFGDVNNKHIIDDLVATKRPVIIAVPHIGNWELCWIWVQLNFPSFGMYSPAKLAQMDKMMFYSRQRFGGQAFDTTPKGIMSLIRRLKLGGVMMILTDQAPRLGSGTYAPFFGQPAYTMTLLHKLLQKTGAELVFGCCLRNKNDKDFSVDLFSPNFDIRVDSAEEFNLGMNKQVESIIALAPDQYQWSYKRFKRQEDGVNLYKK